MFTLLFLHETKPKKRKQTLESAQYGLEIIFKVHSSFAFSSFVPYFTAERMNCFTSILLFLSFVIDVHLKTETSHCFIDVVPVFANCRVLVYICRCNYQKII